MRRRDLMAIAATQQVREMQEGAKLGYNESSFSPVTTRFVSSNIPIGTADFSVEYYGNFVGAAAAGMNTLFNVSCINHYAKGCFMVCSSQENIDKNFIGWILFEGSANADGLYLNYTHANTLPFHLVITRQGATIKAFINGVLKGTKVQSSVKDFPQFKLGLANSSDCRFARIFNYALLPQQIAALYNNGKPEEYLLTAADKVTFDGYRDYTGKVVSYTWNDAHKEYYYYPNCNDKALMPKNTWWECVVELSNYVDGKPFVYLGGDIVPGIDLPLVNGIYTSILQSNGIYNTVGMYGGYRDTSRHLTMTLISVRQVGCIAEYLPQNLTTAHDGDMTDKTPIAWLDSAKQLPLNDEYLPPLLQGVGGYDLTALGQPEIVEKARVVQRQEITDFKVEGSISEGGGNSGQPVATLTKTTDGSVLHCFGDFRMGNAVVNDQYPRLVCTAKQRVGSGTVKMTLEYEIMAGNTQVVYLETYGWSLIKWTNLGVKLAGKFTCQFVSIGLPIGGSCSSAPRLDFGGATFSGGEYKILVKKLIIEEYDKIIN